MHIVMQVHALLWILRSELRDICMCTICNSFRKCMGLQVTRTFKVHIYITNANTGLASCLKFRSITQAYMRRKRPNPTVMGCVPQLDVHRKRSSLLPLDSPNRFYCWYYIDSSWSCVAVWHFFAEVAVTPFGKTLLLECNPARDGYTPSAQWYLERNNAPKRTTIGIQGSQGFP